MIKSVLAKIWPPRYYGIKSFSYFLPAPPKRASGYQEKEFDQLISHLSSQGYELIDIKIQSYSTEAQAGIWAFCKMGALNKEAAKRPINLDYKEVSGMADSAIPMDPDIIHDR